MFGHKDVLFSLGIAPLILLLLIIFIFTTLISTSNERTTNKITENSCQKQQIEDNRADYNLERCRELDISGLFDNELESEDEPKSEDEPESEDEPQSEDSDSVEAVVAENERPEVSTSPFTEVEGVENERLL
ncbi:unnamed protein product [Mucor hiemalis]